MSMRDLFDELMDLPPTQRLARLDEMALGETDAMHLRRMVNAGECCSHLAIPAIDVLRALKDNGATAMLQVGQMVGAFRVLDLLGEGGFALVFKASRPAGTGEQIAAIKLLRTTVFSTQQEHQFRREQAILAQLTHPNISRLIEAGVDATGLPYLAMEYVRGEPITRAAASQKLGLRERLVLFLQLCRAVEAAHSALIIHCDLKPSNILVDASGNLKVLDFGVARLIDSNTEKESIRAFALTPEYAAPEQYYNGAPTIAIDVFSLGVVLGELLTGSRLNSGARVFASDAVSAPDSPAPPDGLPSPRILARLLRGDLDAIIATATEEMPGVRYRSAASLADDIGRYLAGKTVSVRSPSVWYTFSKFARRHRFGVTMTLFSVTALFCSLVATKWQAAEASRAAIRAQVQAARADVMRNLAFDFLSESEPGMVRKGELSVTEAVESAIAKLSMDHSLEPRARLEVLARFADTVGRQGHPDRARELLEQINRDAEFSIGPNDELSFAISERLAYYDVDRGQYAIAENRIDRLLAQVPDDMLELRVKVLRTSASLGWHQRDIERAVRDNQRAVTLSRISKNPELVRTTLNFSGAMLLGIGRVQEATIVYEQVLEIDLAQFGPMHEQVSLAYSGLARAYRRAGDLVRSEQMSRRALEVDRSVFPPGHTTTANHLNALAMTLVLRRDYANALVAGKEALAIVESSVGNDHMDRVIDTSLVGGILLAMEQYDEALPYLEKAVNGYTELLGAAAHRTSLARANYGYAQAMMGNVKNGTADLDLAIQNIEKSGEPNEASADLLGKTLEKRIRIALIVGELETASAHMERLSEVVKSVPFPENQWWTGRFETLKAELLLLQRRPDEALGLLLQVRDKTAGGETPDMTVPVEQHLLLATAYLNIGNLEQAESFRISGQKLLRELQFPPSRLVEIDRKLQKY